MNMLTCKDASQLVSENLERRLSFRERWGLRLHLWICVNCRRFERQMNFLHAALRTLGKRAEVADDSTEFPPEARERIRKALAERIDHDHTH
jgi:hypothetical protein